MRSPFVLLALAAIAVQSPRRAEAWGVVAPVGPTGCEDATHASYFVGGAVGAMRTRVRFDNDEEFALSEQAATAFAGYSTAGGWSIRLAFGALLDGALEANNITHDLAPGIVGALGVARQWKLGDGYWFVTGSAGISIATSSTTAPGAMDVRFTAADARIGAIAGRTFGEMWNPYLLARGFGGPVWWSIDGTDTTGTDTRHFQLGAGLSVVTSIGLTITVDISALGEQGASLGASWRI